MKLLKLLILLGALFDFLNFNLFGQVIIKLNYKDQTLDMPKDSKFKIGQFIKFEIDNYDIKIDDYYIIEYQATEYSNEKVFSTFNATNGDPKKDNASNTDKYHFLPIQIQDKDYSLITIKRYTNDRKTQLEERVYKFQNRNSIKFDVSTGFFLTPQRNESYSLRTKPDSIDKKEIIKDDLGSIRVGLGLLAHLHTRISTWINFGASIGFELNGDSKVGYLAGGSLLFGKDRKFVISGGVALQKVNIKSALYKDINSVNAAISEIPLNEVWESAPFLAFTYNF